MAVDYSNEDFDPNDLTICRLRSILEERGLNVDLIEEREILANMLMEHMRNRSICQVKGEERETIQPVMTTRNEETGKIEMKVRNRLKYKPAINGTTQIPRHRTFKAMLTSFVFILCMVGVCLFYAFAPILNDCSKSLAQTSDQASSKDSTTKPAQLQSLCRREPFFAKKLGPDDMKVRMLDDKVVRLAGHIVKELGRSYTRINARMILVAWLVAHHPEEVDGDAKVVQAAILLTGQVRGLILGSHVIGDPSLLDKFIKLMRDWQAKDKHKKQISTSQEQISDLQIGGSMFDDLLPGNNDKHISLVHNFYLDGYTLKESNPDQVSIVHLRNLDDRQAFVDLCRNQLISLLPTKGKTRKAIEESLSLPVTNETSFKDRLKTIHSYMKLLCAPIRDQQLRDLSIEASHILWMLKNMNLDTQRFHLELLKPHLPDALIKLEQKAWRGKQLSLYTIRLLAEAPSSIFSGMLVGDIDPRRFQLAYLDAERLDGLRKQVQWAIMLAWLTIKFRLNRASQERVSILIQGKKASLLAELGVDSLERDEKFISLLSDRIRCYGRNHLVGLEDSTLSLDCSLAEQQVRAAVTEVKRIYDLHVKIYELIYTIKA